MSANGDWEDDLDAWASAAVEGANNWLVTVRNAEDEGFDPWSDLFTSEEADLDDIPTTGKDSGLMSYAEGLTALAMTDEFADENGWKQLQPELYREDLQYILSEIEDGNYTPEPYLPGDDIDGFTDAVSFTTTTLMEALKSEMNFTGGEIDKTDIREALEKNVQWLLDNELEVGDDAIGWAFAGSENIRDEEVDLGDPDPHYYFTYSAIVPLCDLLIEAGENREIADIVSEREERIERHLQAAKRFLVQREWEDANADQYGHWSTEEYGQPDLLANCYSIIAISYIRAALDEELTEEENRRVAQAVNWLLDEIESNPDKIWSVTVKYPCNGPEYTDGSAPYLMLDTISEYLNYLDDHVGIDYDESTVVSIRDNLARRVLDECWAGDAGYRDKGFRHIKDRENLAANPKRNPTVIYSTQVGIETFLLNFLREEIAGSAGEVAGTTGTTAGTATGDSAGQGASAAPVGGGTTQHIERQFNFNFTVGDEGRIDDVESKVRAIRGELRAIFEDGDGEGASSVDTATLAELNHEFLDNLEDYDNALRDAMKNCHDTATETLPPQVTKETIEQATNLHKQSVGKTLDTFEHLYFEEDPDEFRPIIEGWLDQSRSELLKPWIMEMERLADLDDATIADPVERKREINESIQRLTGLKDEDLDSEAVQEMIAHMRPEEAA